MINPHPILVELLHSELSDIRSRNPSYSLTAFARKIGIGAPALSLVLRGKRALSEKIVRKILMNLQKSEDVINVVLESMRSSKSKSHFKMIPSDIYSLMADWHYFAILSLQETADYQPSIEFISRRLNLSVEKTSEAVDRLINLGFMTKDLVLTANAPERLQTSDGIRDLAVRESLRQSLDNARRSLDSVPVELRDFKALTFAVDVSRLEIAKKITLEYVTRMSAELEMETKTEVYQLCIQLFPLSSQLRSRS